MKLERSMWGELKSLSAFGVIFQYYLGRHCSFKPAGSDEWVLVFPNKGTQGPFHIEHYFGKGKERDRRIRQNFERLASTRRAFLDEDGDFAEAYAPVLVQGRYVGGLISGPVLRHCPTVGSLSQRWKEYSGRSPGKVDGDFIQFARVMLSLCLLGKDGQEAYLRSLEILGAWILDPRPLDVSAELTRLLNESFSRERPHDYWVDLTIRIDRHLSAKERGRAVAPWVRDEIGVTRTPNVAAALMAQPDPSAGTVANLCLQKAFQSAAYRAIRRRPEMAAKMHGDFGVVLLSSVATKGPLRARQAALSEALEGLRREVQEELGCRVHVGVGRMVPEARDLSVSQREALAALEEGLQKGEEIQWSLDDASDPDESAHGATHRLCLDLVSRFGLSPTSHLVPRERLLAQMMNAELGVEAVRVLLVWAYGSLLDRLEAGARLSARQNKELLEAFGVELGEASSQPALFQHFRTALDALVLLADGGERERGDLAIALRSLLKRIEKAPERAWTIKQLSQQCACSAPTFLRRFQELSGESFGAFVRKRRLQRAVDLLRGSQQTLRQVARASGYASASSLVQAFQRHYGSSPGKFRPKARQALT